MVKVDIVSGFLGVGKTTLIKRLLNTYNDENIVIIENEFGDVSIDGDLIKTEGFNVVEINSGCICCSMKKDFEKSFNEIVKTFKPERVMVEPTGINVLSQILDTLKQPEIKNKTEINSIITVIDAMNYLEHIDIFGEFFQDQIINARTLIISKSQRVEESILNKIIDSLRNFNSNAEIISCPWSDFKEDIIENLIKVDLNKEFEEVLCGDINKFDNKRFNTLAIKTYKEFTESEIVAILEKLKTREYGYVIRAKGFLSGYKENKQFSYASGQYEVCNTGNLSIGKLCIIGENLKENHIRRLFKGGFSGLLRW